MDYNDVESLRDHVHWNTIKRLMRNNKHCSDANTMFADPGDKASDHVMEAATFLLLEGAVLRTGTDKCDNCQAASATTPFAYMCWWVERAGFACSGCYQRRRRGKKCNLCAPSEREQDLMALSFDFAQEEEISRLMNERPAYSRG
jgi:hypothetical protein